MTAKVICCVMTGFSKKQIADYIKGIKDGLYKAFEIERKNTWVFVNQFAPEDFCETQAEKTSCNIFMPYGKTDAQKDKFAMEYKQACDRAFGMDSPRIPVATIDEYNLDHEYIHGALLSKK